MLADQVQLVGQLFLERIIANVSVHIAKAGVVNLEEIESL